MVLLKVQLCIPYEKILYKGRHPYLTGFKQAADRKRLDFWEKIGLAWEPVSEEN